MCACASVHLNEFLLPCFCHGSRCYPRTNESRVIDSDRIRKKEKRGGEGSREDQRGRERTDERKEKEREGSEKEGKTHGSKFVPISCALLITPVK